MEVEPCFVFMTACFRRIARNQFACAHKGRCNASYGYQIARGPPGAARSLARQAAQKAAQAADRAEGQPLVGPHGDYRGPAQPSPTIPRSFHGEKSSQVSIMRRVDRCPPGEQFCSGRLSALENLCQVSIIEHKAGGTFDLFDNFVGTGQQEWRQGKSDQAGSLRIDR
jgi:hypothetical protein